MGRVAARLPRHTRNERLTVEEHSVTNVRGEFCRLEHQGHVVGRVATDGDDDALCSSDSGELKKSEKTRGK